MEQSVRLDEYVHVHVQYVWLSELLIHTECLSVTKVNFSNFHKLVNLIILLSDLKLLGINLSLVLI